MAQPKPQPKDIAVRPQPGISVPNWPSAVTTIAVRSMDSGFGWIIVLAGMILFACWRLPPEALARMLREALYDRWFAIGGWAIAAVTVVVAMGNGVLRKRIDERRLSGLAGAEGKGIGKE